MRVLVLLLLAIFPVSLLLIYTVGDVHRHDKQDLQQQALRLAQCIALQHAASTTPHGQLRLDWLNQAHTLPPIDDGMRVTVIDQHGTILAHHPATQPSHNQARPDRAIVQRVLTQQAGVAELPDQQGRWQLMGFMPLPAAQQAAYVIVSLPAHGTLLPSHTLLLHTLLTVGIVGWLTLAIAWLGGHYFLVSPLTILIQTTRRLAAGDLAARTGITPHTGELGYLAGTIDQMAAALEQQSIATRQTLHMLQQRVALEDLITTISARLIHVSAPQVDAAMNRALQATGACIQADRASITIFADDGLTIAHMYQWCTQCPEQRPHPSYDGASLLPPSRDGLPPCTLRICPQASPLLPQANNEHLHWRTQEQTTVVGIPLLLGDDLLGFFELCWRQRDVCWRTEDTQLLRVLGDMFVGVLERKRTEEAIQALNADLERRVAERTAELAAKNAELETFAYSVAHDLKAPLRGIDGYSRLLLADYANQLDAEGQLFLANICRATEQMHQLINALLTYSRLERRPFEHHCVDLGRLIETIVSERAYDLHHLHMSLRVAIADALVVADHDGLCQALRNLLDNAIKFTRNVPDPAIEIGSCTDTQSLLLWVRDNGIGFDMEYHERIFELFERLHHTNEHPGTGIGLAIVRKAIQRMGGRVWATSTPGAGATFYLELRRWYGDPGTSHSAHRRQSDGC